MEDFVLRKLEAISYFGKKEERQNNLEMGWPVHSY
jgi:hypothetical protein